MGMEPLASMESISITGWTMSGICGGFELNNPGGWLAGAE